jgi:hypothetical protein
MARNNQGDVPIIMAGLFGGLAVLGGPAGLLCGLAFASGCAVGRAIVKRRTRSKDSNSGSDNTLRRASSLHLPEQEPKYGIEYPFPSNLHPKTDFNTPFLASNYLKPKSEYRLSAFEHLRDLEEVQRLCTPVTIQKPQSSTPKELRVKPGTTIRNESFFSRQR